MTKPVFELNGITHQYGRVKVLDDFSMVGERGEVIAILGENGAGKTTAIRILLGLIRPKSGTSTVFGLRSEQRSNEIRRRLGYVSDEPALYDYMTPSEIGWYSAGFYEPGYVDRYRAHLETFNVPLTTKIKSLSRGQKAKVALALGMSHEPELLVMDEPTAGLDPVVRRQFLESMVDIAASGNTVLLASHQVDEVERVADRVAIVKNGKLELFEPISQLKDDVREVRVTWRNGSQDLPAITSVNLLSRRDAERQSNLLIRGFDPTVANLWHDSPTVSDIEVHSPSLEEIYIGCMSEVNGGEAGS